jgi:hypothetical protein
VPSLERRNRPPALEVVNVHQPIYVAPYQEGLFVGRKARDECIAPGGPEDSLDGPLVSVQDQGVPLGGVDQDFASAPVEAYLVDGERRRSRGLWGRRGHPVGHHRLVHGLAGELDLRKGPALVVPGVVQMHVVALPAGHFRQDHEDHPGRIKDRPGLSGCPDVVLREVHLGETSRLLEVPEADRLVLARRQKHILGRADVDLVDAGGVAAEFPQYFVVVQAPILDRRLFVSRRQDAVIIVAVRVLRVDCCVSYSVMRELVL